MKENVTKEEHIRLGLQMSNMNSTNEILSMYSKGITAGDIESCITDKIPPVMKRLSTSQ